ncbi:MAG: exodeoxyribonuclease VII small subunit [Cyclobacteriaceae bacterium]
MPRKKTNNPQTYRDALLELQTIVQSVEDQELDVDELADKVKQALKLIEFCKKHLKNTQDTLDQAFEAE